MTILLTGGGSGGHITPLLAVAREIKTVDPSVKLIGVCERGAKFLHLFKDCPDIDEVYEVRAGKYRRYAGLSKLEKITDVKTIAQNTRDVGRVARGYTEARKLLKKLNPDGILIKGGFVGVPVGLAAASLKIPFITHDSDTLPGLANRIIGRWAAVHATGMPAEFYSYPKNKTVYTGVPVSERYALVTKDEQQAFKTELGLGECGKVITVIAGSQGGSQLNDDLVSLAGRLMQRYPDLGILHIAGDTHQKQIEKDYAKELLSDELKHIVVKGFVSDAYRYTAAADIVVTRASATVTAELALQAKAAIMVPGRLAGDHQSVNARHLAKAKAAAHVLYGDAEGLYTAIVHLVDNPKEASDLSGHLHDFARANAARDLADLTLKTFKAS